jgi:nitroimidazol reductase NimA-like FMN-containing flavoprotein (pyridoxamine 5'-phosphate oxidase superfamily)
VTGFRLTDDEAWAFVEDARIGILTTLRGDGVPIAMPVWFAACERQIYVRTRGQKLVRIGRDPRASFLVERGRRWADLQAVHLTGRACAVDPDRALRDRLEREMERKYRDLRLEPAAMPRQVSATYSAGMRWVAFTPDERLLSWNNRALLGDPTSGADGDT